MATTKGAAGPSNFQSSVNLMCVWAPAGPPASTAATAAAMSASPARPRREASNKPIDPLLSDTARRLCVAHVLVGEPVSTSPEHALARQRPCRHYGRQTSHSGTHALFPPSWAGGGRVAGCRIGGLVQIRE